MSELKVQVINESPDTLTLEITGLGKDLVNGLRRACMAEVPTVAVDEVLFVENTSPLYNEYIAHRLGLLPLKTPGEPEQLAQLSMDIEEGRPPTTRIDYQLRQECPNEAEGPLTVYSSDLKTIGEDSTVEPVNKNVQLFKLGNGQIVEFQAFARYGIGLQHAKFSPVSPVSFFFKPVLKFDKEKQFNCEEHVSICPVDCLRYTDGELMFTDAWKCILCRACEKDCKTGAVQILWDENAVRFTVESTGSLQPRTIVKTAALILVMKMRRVRDALKAQRVKEEAVN
ncbi:MAG: DNA-directed RNA polymerase subunit D [Candidatus Marsarchaeota archaeon]|nr:DNA-directed RNA polymerase subunit D [Candidatus Marsarchaeota archaeon]